MTGRCVSRSAPHISRPPGWSRWVCMQNHPARLLRSRTPARSISRRCYLPPHLALRYAIRIGTRSRKNVGGDCIVRACVPRSAVTAESTTTFLFGVAGLEPRDVVFCHKLGHAGIQVRQTAVVQSRIEFLWLH